VLGQIRGTLRVSTHIIIISPISEKISEISPTHFSNKPAHVLAHSVALLHEINRLKYAAVYKTSFHTLQKVISRAERVLHSIAYSEYAVEVYRA